MNASWQEHVVALGWVPTGDSTQGAQLALPTDLFMVTVHHGAASDAGFASPLLEMSVTLLRTRAQRFVSSRAGDLAFALLTPVGLLALLRAPLRGATDRSIALREFCGASECRALSKALRDCASAAERVVRFGRWIEGRIRQRQRITAPQARVAQAASVIQADDGPLKLDPLRARLQVSQRQLERDFQYWLGLSPAGYARLVRFQRAAMAIADGESLGHAAAGHAFSDQAHMSRVFRQLSGLTPGQVVRLSATPRRAAIRRALAGRVALLDAP
jgi:AraC-like DNA-binding protein